MNKKTLPAQQNPLIRLFKTDRNKNLQAKRTQGTSATKNKGAMTTKIYFAIELLSFVRTGALTLWAVNPSKILSIQLITTNHYDARWHPVQTRRIWLQSRDVIISISQKKISMQTRRTQSQQNGSKRARSTNRSTRAATNDNRKHQSLNERVIPNKIFKTHTLHDD